MAEHASATFNRPPAALVRPLRGANAHSHPPATPAPSPPFVLRRCPVPNLVLFYFSCRCFACGLPFGVSGWLGLLPQGGQLSLRWRLLPSHRYIDGSDRLVSNVVAGSASARAFPSDVLFDTLWGLFSRWCSVSGVFFRRIVRLSASHPPGGALRRLRCMARPLRIAPLPPTINHKRRLHLHR